MSTDLGSSAQGRSKAQIRPSAQVRPIAQVRPVPQDGTESQASTHFSRPPQKPALRSLWVRSSLVTLAVIAILAAGSAWMMASSSSSDVGPLLTHTITRGDLVVTVTEQGTLESSNNQEIKCKVRGYSKVTWVVAGGTEVEPGDELVRLDTKRIEDAIGKHTTDAHIARATYERTLADVATAEIAIDAYVKGSYRSHLKGLEKQLTIAQSNLLTAKKMLGHSESMFKRGYVSELEVEGNRFTVTQANLELKVRENAIEVLKKYTKEMQLETLRGSLNSTKSKFKADKAGLAMDEGRRDRAIQELDFCVIKADRSGLVIYPSAAAWKDTPDVAEGVNVRKDQVLLLMPDLSKMQVKIGIHESLIDRIQTGLIARVTLPDVKLEGQVTEVASVARPAGWWTGNVVKYDTIIELPSVEGLKPGMSAEVEVIMAEHQDVVTVPVAAVIETADESLCWVSTDNGVERRPITLGDSNDVFIIVNSGLTEGDQVVLNPLAYIEDAQAEALQTIDESAQGQREADESNQGAIPSGAGA
jgi:HlyD family secretion protein